MAASYYGYHWDPHTTAVYATPSPQQQHQQHQPKSKKSLAERIGRTFDRIALPGPPKETRSSPSQYVAATPAAVWTAAAAAAAFSPPHHHYHRGPPHTSLLYPWEHHYASAAPVQQSIQQSRHGEVTYDFPSSPATRVSPVHQFCGCQDFLFGSVRGGGFNKSSRRCQHCRKVRPVFLPRGHRQSPPPKHPLNYRNPYDYARHQGQPGGGGGRVSADEDWQTYWVEDSEVYARRQQQQQQQAAKEGSKAVKSASEDSSSSSSSSEGESSSSSSSCRRSILDPGLNPYELNEVKDDEEDLRPEDKDLCTVNEEEVTEESEEISVTEDKEDKAEEVPSTADPVVILPEQRTSTSTASSLLPRKKFYKRRTPFQIDAVILEEDEEALEAENVEVFASSATHAVKSILKQRSVDVAIDIDIAPSEVKKTSDDVALPLKKEVTFSGEEEDKEIGDSMGTVSSSAACSPCSPDDDDEEAATVIDSPTSSDDQQDDWFSYDKVIVSHNLAEEILDEIYGRLEPKKKLEQEAEDKESREGFAEVAKATKSDSKSMADEILDELYGTHEEKLKVFGRKHNERASSTKRRDRRMLLLLHSKDDSALPDNKAVFDWSHRLSANLARPDCNSSGGSGGRTMSALFHDTTRLRFQQRPSLAALFCHEAPSLGEGRRTRFIQGPRPCSSSSSSSSRPRPREPPPPPPPVSEVLKPVVPPKKFGFPCFTKAEEERINSVINGDSISEEEDEFSSDEFDSIVSSDDVSRATSASVRKDDLYDVAEFVEIKLDQDDEGKDDDVVSNSGCSSQGDSSFLVESQHCLIDSRDDRTVIRTSSQVRSPSLQLLASSACKTDNGPSMPQGGGEGKHEILISSSSWINVQVDPPSMADGARFKREEEEEEPVKPPRLKKLARLQRMQLEEQMLHRAKSEGDMNKLGSIDNLRFSASTSKNIIRSPLSAERPEISSPVLLATTFNPNDAERHRSLAARKSYLSQLSEPSDKISFKELKRLSSLFPSFSSLNFSKDISSLTGRSSFYVAEAVYEEAGTSRRQAGELANEHIYEEIPEHHREVNQRPLPPIPELLQTQQQDSSLTLKQRGSIFEGASKYEILHYLRNAKDRIGHADFEIELDDEGFDSSFLGKRNHTHRVSAISNSSDSSSCSVDSMSGGSSVASDGGGGGGSSLGLKSRMIIDIERNDSGVGSETSKSSFKHRRAFVRANYRSRSSEEEQDLEDEENRCFDCNLWLDRDISTPESVSGVVCIKCCKRRAERKEIITELYETELKYGRDLRIIVEEFYRPMLVAGLLSSDQLAGIFLNAEELIQVNSCFSSILRSAIEEAALQGDEDLCTVNVGRLFLEALFMLRAYESYCTRQASASFLLTTLEREKELLKIFLKVSQMENSTLRRMNLSSFLMVPVQRVTKYPLLLARLQKVTPSHHKDKEAIKNAKEKIEAALEQMNKEAKDVNSSKLWKRLPIINSSKKIELTEEEESERMKKLTSDTLGWKREEIKFPLEGRLQFAQPSEANWKRPWTGRMTSVHACIAVLSVQSLPDITTNKELIFAQDTNCIKEASLIIFREKNNSKSTLAREPLSLERCIICCEPEWEHFFEIQEFVSKETFVFKGDDAENTRMWFQTLQFYTQSLGGWRKRRKGLGNIMVDPKVMAETGAIPHATAARAEQSEKDQE